MAGAGIRGGREGAGWWRAGGGDAAPGAALRWGVVRRVRLAGVAAPAAPDQRRPCRRRRRRGGSEADGAAAAGRSEAGTPYVAAGHGPLDGRRRRQRRRRPSPPALPRQWRIGRRRAGATQSRRQLRWRRSRRRLRRFLRRITPAAATAFSVASAAANGAVAGPGLRWRRRRRGRVRRRVAAAGRGCGRRRGGAAQAARTGAARPGYRPPQHRGAAPEREDRGEDEGAAGAGAQRQQDGQGVDAGRDHRLRQVPAAPSQGAEHEPARWRRCRRAARGRHVLGGSRRGGGRGRGRERWPGGDGAAGGEADGGGHGHRHAVPAGEGPVPHARLPRLRHILRDVPHATAGGGTRTRVRRRRAPYGRHAVGPRHERRRWKRSRRRAGLPEHVRAHGAVGHEQRRRGWRGLALAAAAAFQGRRVRVEAVIPSRRRRPPLVRFSNGETMISGDDGVGLHFRIRGSSLSRSLGWTPWETWAPWRALPHPGGSTGSQHCRSAAVQQQPSDSHFFFSFLFLISS